MKAKEMDLAQAEMTLTLDEFKFHDAKIRRKNETLEKELSGLMESEATLLEEKQILQDKLSSVFNENKSLSEAFQSLKEEYDKSASFNANLRLSAQESTLMCEAAMKQKKQTAIHLEAMTNKHHILEEKVERLEDKIRKKDAEIQHLVEKVKRTIKEYEELLMAKDKKLNEFKSSILEENKRHKIQVAQVKLDPDYIKLLEKKHLLKEAQLVGEIARNEKTISAKDEAYLALQNEMAELMKSSFAPRMEALTAVEVGILAQLDEISVAEEKLEHSFSSSSLRDAVRRQRGVPINNCPVCHVQITSSFKNAQLDRIVVNYVERKGLSVKLTDWCAVLTTLRIENEVMANKSRKFVPVEDS